MIKLTLIALAVSLTLVPTAGAALLNGTHAGKGTVVDTVNQTEWLDVNETTGLSPNQALAANPDYRWATIADLQPMIDQFFLANPPAPTSYVLVNDSSDLELIDGAQTQAFTDLFGFHATDPGYTDSFYDDGDDDGNQDTFHIGDASSTPFIWSTIRNLNGTPDGDLSSNILGVWMVRDIPEPASAALLGLAGLAMLGRRRRRAS